MPAFPNERALQVRGMYGLLAQPFDFDDANDTFLDAKEGPIQGDHSL